MPASHHPLAIFVALSAYHLPFLTRSIASLVELYARGAAESIAPSALEGDAPVAEDGVESQHSAEACFDKVGRDDDRTERERAVSRVVFSLIMPSGVVKCAVRR